MQPPRFAAGVASRFAFLAQFFRFGCLRSGSSCCLEHIASSFRLQFYLLRSLLPRSLRSLWSAWSLRATKPLRFIAGEIPPVHPLPHNVRHLPVTPSLSIRSGLRCTPAEQLRSSAASCPAASSVVLLPSSTGCHMAGVAVTSRTVRSVVPPSLPAWSRQNPKTGNPADFSQTIIHSRRRSAVE